MTMEDEVRRWKDWMAQVESDGRATYMQCKHPGTSGLDMLENCKVAIIDGLVCEESVYHPYVKRVCKNRECFFHCKEDLDNEKLVSSWVEEM